MAFSTLHDDAGSAAGVLATGIETTEKLHTEAALRASEARQAFLLALSDGLRPLGDPAAVRREASRILRAHLGASRVLYTEAVGPNEIQVVAFDHDPDLQDWMGNRFRLSDFGPELEAEFRAGQTTWRNDVASDQALSDAERAAYATWQVRSWANAPLVKDDRLVAMLTADFADAHEWTADELQLLEETAERTWAFVERSRA
jgi:GAF domain-containing protein